MCYYSLYVRNEDFRPAKEGEDLTVSRHDGHHVARGSDGMIVCMKGGSTAHIAKLELRRDFMRDYERYTPKLMRLIGKPVTGKFREPGDGWSADCFVFNDMALPLVYIAAGVTFYLGAKRPTLETRLGVDDPSIALDHNSANIETPTLGQTVKRVIGICSITR